MAEALEGVMGMFGTLTATVIEAVGLERRRGIAAARDGGVDVTTAAWTAAGAARIGDRGGIGTEIADNPLGINAARAKARGDGMVVTTRCGLMKEGARILCKLGVATLPRRGMRKPRYRLRSG